MPIWKDSLSLSDLFFVRWRVRKWLIRGLCSSRSTLLSSLASSFPHSTSSPPFATPPPTLLLGPFQVPFFHTLIHSYLYCFPKNHTFSLTSLECQILFWEKIYNVWAFDIGFTFVRVSFNALLFVNGAFCLSHFSIHWAASCFFFLFDPLFCFIVCGCDFKP